MAILIDTGVFYALLDKGDVNHLDAVAVMAHTLEGNIVKPRIKLYLVGHKDIIDNLLYATSITMKDFLVKHSFSVENFMGHEQLLRKLGF